MCNNQYMKSVLEVYNPNPQNLIANTGLVQYAEKVTKTGGSISYDAPATVTLNKSGIYLILFTANIATGTTEGNITTSLNENNVSVASVTTIATTTSTNENIIIPQTIVIPKSCNCIDNTKIITVTNTGIAATYNSVDLIVIKMA